jgi:hypothetical protein
MARAQITLFVIIGLVFVIIAAFLLNLRSFQTEPSRIDYARQQITEYLANCATQAIIKANVAYGIRESTADEYEEFIASQTQSCTSSLMPLMKNFKVLEKGYPHAFLEINIDNLIVDIFYPIEVSDSRASFLFEKYVKEFQRRAEKCLDQDAAVILSPDMRFRLSIPFQTVLTNLTQEIDCISIRIEDKEDNEVLGNLVYGFYPEGIYSSKPVEIQLRYDDMVLPHGITPDDLRIAWKVPGHNEWGFLPTEASNGFLKATTDYLTDFSIVSIAEFPDPDEAPKNDDIPLAPLPDIPDVPPVSSQPYSGNAYEIYNQIKTEMGGTYSLILNPQCTAPPFITTNSICRTGYSKQCGITGVHCIASKLPSNPNVLFRHEIVHNIQQLNNDCNRFADRWARTEWGAEYISGSNYNTFRLSGQPVSAAHLTSIMLAKGCSEAELRAAAFCIPGAFDLLEAKGCLPAGNRVAD